MELGTFSVSLSVRDLATTRDFYQKLGFEVFHDQSEQGYLILRNGDATIGLFQGMFEGNILTFNPGWDREAQALETFEDVRDSQARLDADGVALADRADDASTGPASLMLTDPEGNVILIDQHVPRPGAEPLLAAASGDLPTGFVGGDVPLTLEVDLPVVAGVGAIGVRVRHVDALLAHARRPCQPGLGLLRRQLGIRWRLERGHEIDARLGRDGVRLALGIDPRAVAVLAQSTGELAVQREDRVVHLDALLAHAVSPVEERLLPIGRR